MFQIIQSAIPGCYVIIFKQMKDNRGSFVKIFHKDVFDQLNIKIDLGEEFYSVSTKNVFRGMHFQVPPRAVDKIVTCISGNITDYVVDLRVGSPTYKKHLAFELDGNTPKALFIPKGLAHGFMVNSNEAIVHYKCSDVYDPACDTGITYRSFDFAKDIKDPIISEKDLNLVSLDNFSNPFKF